jgi:hypothetical protein
VPCRTITVKSHDLAGVVDVTTVCRPRTGRVERAVAAIHVLQVTVVCAASKITSHDLARVVDPLGKGIARRVGRVERGVAAIYVEQEAADSRAIHVPSHDLT